jgi:hypothetical protein
MFQLRSNLMAQLRTVKFSVELLFDLFGPGHHPGGYTVVKDAIPEDARLINVRHDWPNSVEFLIESPSFPELGRGDELSPLIPVVERDQ